MGILEINDLNFELRKINVIKLGRRQEEPNEDISEESEESEEFPAEIKLGVKQKKDKKNIELYALYTIPSIANFDLEIDAEFKGFVSLKEPLDIDTNEEDSHVLKEFIQKNIMPKITKEIDKALFPIFKSMNVKYECLAKKSSEDNQ